MKKDEEGNEVYLGHTLVPVNKDLGRNEKFKRYKILRPDQSQYWNLPVPKTREEARAVVRELVDLKKLPSAGETVYFTHDGRPYKGSRLSGYKALVWAGRKVFKITSADLCSAETFKQYQATIRAARKLRHAVKKPARRITRGGRLIRK